MKKTTLFMVSVLALAVLCAPAFAAGVREDASLESYSGLTVKEVTVTDMIGNEVTIKGTPERIVSLLASDVEILYELGAGDQIVGVGQWCNYPSQAQSDNEVIATGAETNLEQILSLDPDLVIMGTMAQDLEQAEQLRAAGIPVIVTDSDSISDVYTSIELLAKATGHEERGLEIIDYMKTSFAEIKKRDFEEGKTVYFEISPLEWGLWTAGNGTFMQELCEMVGAENIFGDITGWSAVDEEQVIARNPDYIVTVTMYFGEGPTPDEEIVSRANWQDITAVRNHSVLCADNDEITRPGPRLVIAANQLADFVQGR